MTRFRNVLDNILTQIEDLPRPLKRVSLEKLCIGVDRVAQTAYRDAPEIRKLAMVLRGVVFDIT
jgi:hypothetical protein